MQEQLFTTILSGGSAGIVAGLLLVILGFVSGRIIPGYQYKALEAKLARYEELAFKSITLAERASKDGGAG